MSTIYAFNETETAVTTPPAATDAFLVYNAAAKATRQVPGALISESARTVTAGTTSSAFPAYGITRASTLASVNTLTDPTQAGQETTILFPITTAIQTVSPVAALIFGSTQGNELVGASKITRTPTSDGFAGSITLVAASTSQWFIKSLVTAYSTAFGPGQIKTT